MAVSSIPVLALASLLFFSSSPTPKHYSKKAPSYTKASKPIRSVAKRAPVRSSSPKGPSIKDVQLGNKRFNPKREQKALYRYIKTHYKHVSDEDAEQISKSLVKYGEKHNLDPKLVAAVIAKESSFNKKAESPTGAKGLGQIKPFNFPSLGIKDPENIQQNVSGTTQYIKRLLKRWQTNSKGTSLAIASYYEGPNAVQQSRGKLSSDTSSYVKRVLKKYNEIKEKTK